MDIVALIAALVLSFGFGLLFAALLYWLDRYEKEPALLLGGVFLWGATVSAGMSFVINTVLGLGAYVISGSDVFTELVVGSLIAPPVEESLKALAVLLVFLLFRNEFDSVMDGIVYAGVAGLGFAATENVMYLFSAYREDGFSFMAVLLVLRILLGGWNHAFYTAWTGIGLAVARLNRNPLVKIGAPLAGWGFAVLTHSIHNSLPGLLDVVGLVLMLLMDWGGWLVMFGIILWAVYRQGRWMRTYLREEVQHGVITPAQYQTACSSWAQTGARFNALFSGRYQDTRRFYELCATLAFKKHQRVRVGEEKSNTTMIEELRRDLGRLSAQLKV